MKHYDFIPLFQFLNCEWVKYEEAATIIAEKNNELIEQSHKIEALRSARDSLIERIRASNEALKEWKTKWLEDMKQSNEELIAAQAKIVQLHSALSTGFSQNKYDALFVTVRNIASLEAHDKEVTANALQDAASDPAIGPQCADRLREIANATMGDVK